MKDKFLKQEDELKLYTVACKNGLVKHTYKDLETLRSHTFSVMLTRMIFLQLYLYIGCGSNDIVKIQ